MTATPLPCTPVHDSLEHHNRVYLEKQRLAASAILELGEESMITDTLITELHFFRDRIDRALLFPEAVGEILPWMDAPAPRPVPTPAPAPGGDGPSPVA